MVASAITDRADGKTARTSARRAADRCRYCISPAYPRPSHSARNASSLNVPAGRPGGPATDSAPWYIFALSTVALAVVLYLAYASFYVLREVCPLCVTT